MAAAQAAAAAAVADVEAALREADKAAKKQKVCAASSAQAINKMLQVREGGCTGPTDCAAAAASILR